MSDEAKSLTNQSIELWGGEGLQALHARDTGDPGHQGLDSSVVRVTAGEATLTQMAGLVGGDDAKLDLS